VYTERSPFFCSSLNRKAKWCGKVGHHVTDDGRRWCPAHFPEGAEVVKQPVVCQGRLADVSPCKSHAEQIVLVEGEGELALCHFHSRLLAATGSVQHQSKRERKRTNATRSQEENGDLSEAEEELLGGLRSQLSAAGDEMGDLILDRLKRMLRSESVTANSAAIKILLDR
jgi:hypothetical protein